jgi:ADP-dependent NAD(P)H-hydrate dehydratase / NAD(P)H-hydrate epimerase
VVRLLWPEAVITVTGQDIPAGEDVHAAGRVQAWVVGPGMGTDDQARERLAAVLASDVPVLVDADGLTLLAAHKGLLSRDAPTLLTPHAGELGRLLGVDPADVESHRLEHARKAAASLGATVLLKGSSTVIATPDGRSARTQAGSTQDETTQDETTQDEAGQDGVSQDDLAPVWVNSTGTSWLATAGTGDVLSGLAGSLLAQGLEVGEAAAAAAYLHGLAARLAAAGAGARPAPAVEPSSGGWDITNAEDPRAGYAEAPIAAADVIGALPDAIRSVRRQAR